MNIPVNLISQGKLIIVFFIVVRARFLIAAVAIMFLLHPLHFFFFLLSFDVVFEIKHIIIVLLLHFVFLKFPFWIFPSFVIFHQSLVSALGKYVKCFIVSEYFLCCKVEVYQFILIPSSKKVSRIRFFHSSCLICLSSIMA